MAKTKASLCPQTVAAVGRGTGIVIMTVKRIGTATATMTVIEIGGTATRTGTVTATGESRVCVPFSLMTQKEGGIATS